MDLSRESPAPGAGSMETKILITVEVCMRSTSTARHDDIRDAVVTYLEDVGSVIYTEGELPMPSAEDDPYLHAHVESARVTDLGTSHCGCDSSQIPAAAPAPAPTAYGTHSHQNSRRHFELWSANSM
jgi:hypothetical protein